MAEKKLVYVCEGGDCSERGSMELYLELKGKLAERDTTGCILARKYPCFGGCEYGVNVVVHPDSLFYSEVKEEDLDEIVSHLVGEGEPLTRLCGKVPQDVEEIIFELLNTGF